MTAVVPAAFAQALKLVRRRGTVVCVGLPPGDFAVPILEVVLRRLTLRGSIVGNRKDLADALAFAAEGKVKVRTHLARLADVSQVLADLKAGRIAGRAVLTRA